MVVQNLVKVVGFFGKHEQTSTRGKNGRRSPLVINKDRDF